MIRVVRPSGETLALDRDGLATVLDVAIAVKSELGIPRGQQRYLLDDEVLPMLSDLPHHELLLTLVRVRTACRLCGRRGRRRKKQRACGGCFDAHYCDEVCQRGDWNRHRSECCRADR